MLSGGSRTREGREVGAETRVKWGGQYHVKSLLVSVLQRSRTKGSIYKETYYKELAHAIIDATRSQDLQSWETEAPES